MDPFFNYLEKIDNKYPAWDLLLFFILIYLPILKRLYIVLTVEVVNCITAILTFFIAFFTWRIAKNSLKVAEESNNLAKFQLTERLSLKLYE